MKSNKSTANRVFGLVLGACILGSLLQTAMNTLIPAVMEDFSLTAATAQWLVSGYSLIMGVMTPLTAWLLKRVPTRALYLGSFVLFAVGTALCGAAPSFALLMVGRGLQAVGTAVLTSMTQVVIFAIFPVEKRGSVMGLYGLAVGAAPILAPTLAGIIKDLWGWRMMFGVALVLAIPFLLMGFKSMTNALETAKEDLDVVSAAACALGLTGLTLGLGNVASKPFLSLSVALPLLVGIAALTFFTLRLLRAEHPFLDLKLMGNREFCRGVVGSMLLYAGMLGAAMLLPLYIQGVRGMSATVSGMVTMPGSLVTILISPLAGKLYDKMGVRKLFLSGSLLLALGCLGISFLTASTPLWLVILMFVLRQAAIGAVMMPIATWAMSTLRGRATADGTAILGTLRTVAGAIGSAVFVSLSSAIAENAGLLKGINRAFLGITILAVVQLVFGIVFVRGTEAAATD